MVPTGIIAKILPRPKIESHGHGVLSLSRYVHVSAVVSTVTFKFYRPAIEQFRILFKYILFTVVTIYINMNPFP